MCVKATLAIVLPAAMLMTMLSVAHAESSGPRRLPGCSELKARVNDPNARFADTGSPILALAEARGMQALYYNDTTLSPEVREAIRARLTHFVACAPPVYQGQVGGLKLVWTDKTFPAEWYANVLNFRTWTRYSEPERLAMEFAERFVLEPGSLNADDAFWRRAQAHFTDAQLFDMALMVSTWKRRIDMQVVLGTKGPPESIGARVQKAQTDPSAAIGAGTLAMVAAAEKRVAEAMPKR